MSESSQPSPPPGGQFLVDQTTELVLDDVRLKDHDQPFDHFGQSTKRIQDNRTEIAEISST
jgi:hypothetical protein